MIGMTHTGFDLLLNFTVPGEFRSVDEATRTLDCASIQSLPYPVLNVQANSGETRGRELQ